MPQSAWQIWSPACWQRAPQSALLFPVQDGGKRLELLQVNRVAAALRPRQEQQGFLNIGS